MSGGFSVPGHNEISNASGQEILKREAYVLLLTSCIDAKLVANAQSYIEWSDRIWADVDVRLKATG